MEEVAAFREQVRTVLVPLCEKLYEAQRKRLGVDTLMFYDENVYSRMAMQFRQGMMISWWIRREKCIMN